MTIKKWTREEMAKLIDDLKNPPKEPKQELTVEKIRQIRKALHGNKEKNNE